MFTVLKIIWNNTSLAAFFQFNIREGSSKYEYFVRFIGHVIVLIFFLVIFVFGVGGLCINLIYDARENWKSALFIICIMLPIMSRGLLVWYIYVMENIKRAWENLRRMLT